MRQLEIPLIVPSLTVEQAVIELAQFFIQMRHQSGKPLAATRLDEGADHQGVDQLDRFVGPHYSAQPRGITPSRERAQGDLATLHQTHHLLVVHQFFARQARHHVDQVHVRVVLGHQAQRGAGSLELAVLVVDQQGFLVGKGRLDPGIRRTATKERFNFRNKGHRLTKQAGQRQEQRLYRRRRRSPVTML
ncbi:hypothetical protein D3C72_1796820 [compost metagenome]